MGREKVDIFTREILFKSPVEYDVQFIRGMPVYYITAPHSNMEINELLGLNPDTREYELLETSDDFVALHEKALKLTFEIMDQLGKLKPYGEEREKLVASILKEQRKRYFNEE